MEKSYEELLNILKKETKVINEQGLEIMVKRIPDYDEEGVFDPRVLEVRKREKETNTEFGHGRTVADIRAGMGWPNRDVTDGTVRCMDRTIQGKNGDIPVKIYIPEEDKKRPCLIFFHGGGFFGGTLACVENPCKCIARYAGAAVISVDYRLAPEHPFPQGLEDCFYAVSWAYNNSQLINIDKEKIGVCGDSAGGNLAAVCTLKDKNSGTNWIKFQAMLYPAVDIGMLRPGYEWSMDSYCIKEQDELITESVTALGKNADLLIGLYLNGIKELAENEYVSPIFAKDVSRLPPALIITAEYDYLRLEGEAYARKLKEAGVPVRMIRYNGMDHAFMDKIGLYPQAEDAMREVAENFLCSLKKEISG